MFLRVPMAVLFRRVEERGLLDCTLDKLEVKWSRDGVCAKSDTCNSKEAVKEKIKVLVSQHMLCTDNVSQMSSCVTVGGNTGAVES